MRSSRSAEELDRLFRSEAARAVATLGRVFNDFDRAEDAVQDAYALALSHWQRDGVPRNPAAWIVVTARNKAIDRLRRERVAAEKGELLAQLEALMQLDDLSDDEPMDDRLGMIFAACHPALNEDTRIALTLRYAAGLTVPEIAAALLVAPAAIAQRLVRAKHKIVRARIAFAVPAAAALPERIDDILHVIYLIFNEGYASSTHAQRVRGDLCDEALRLGLLLDELLPNEPEIAALNALMLFHDARRPTRTDLAGNLLLLEDQDRSRWDTAKITRGLELLARGVQGVPRVYRLQAMIAAEHARARTWSATDWRTIRTCYDVLAMLDDSPVVRLNRGVAVAYADGPQAGLTLVDELCRGGVLDEFAPLFAVRAELLRRLGRPLEARRAYERAAALTKSEPERRFLQNKIGELIGKTA